MNPMNPMMNNRQRVQVAFIVLCLCLLVFSVCPLLLRLLFSAASPASFGVDIIIDIGLAFSTKPLSNPSCDLAYHTHFYQLMCPMIHA